MYLQRDLRQPGPGQRAFHGKRPLESRAVRPSAELNALREGAIKHIYLSNSRARDLVARMVV